MSCGICNCGGLGVVDMERHGIAIVVEDGVQVQVQQLQPRRIERQALLMARKTGRSHGDQGMGPSVVSSTSALDFFWRIFARVARYVTRVRRLLVFKHAKDGSLVVKEERRTSERESKVEGGRMEASRGCGPELAEILVTSQKETTNHDIHDVDTKVKFYHEDCPRKCTTESKDKNKELGPLGCLGELTLTSEQLTSHPCQQEPLSVPCEPVIVILPELHGEDCTANEQQKSHSLEQAASQEQARNEGLCRAGGEENCHSPELNGSQDEELVDAAINNKSDVLQSLSQLSADNSNPENSLKGSSDVESLDLTSSRALKKRFSIKDLNAVVAEQLAKCLHALERNMVPGKAEHRRAIILATLVVIAVWARNAKHLHESMPRIRGSAINVHIRSRL